MKLYYFITVVANILSVIFFRDRLNVSVMSVLPLLLMGLSIIQAVYFHNNRRKTDFNINNDADLTEEEWGKMALYMRNSYLLSIPLFIPFITFFSMWVKLLSLLLFFIAFAGGAVYFRVRHKDECEARWSREVEELKEQQRKEELGNW